MRKIVAWLSTNGISARLILDADILIVYCLYWWASFARGYLFEQEIIRDLTKKGIRFNAHQSEPDTMSFEAFDEGIQRLAQEVITETIEVTGIVQGDKIVFESANPTLIGIHQNELWIGGLRLIINLRQPDSSAICFIL